MFKPQATPRLRLGFIFKRFCQSLQWKHSHTCSAAHGMVTEDMMVVEDILVALETRLGMILECTCQNMGLQEKV